MENLRVYYSGKSLKGVRKMKNLLESFAVLLVGLLSLLIVYFIVQYNMIEDQVIEDVDYTVTDTKDKAKDNDLDSLEDDDEDIDVDATE